MGLIRLCADTEPNPTHLELMLYSYYHLRTGTILLTYHRNYCLIIYRSLTSVCILIKTLSKSLHKSVAEPEGLVGGRGPSWQPSTPPLQTLMLLWGESRVFHGVVVSVEAEKGT